MLDLDVSEIQFDQSEEYLSQPSYAGPTSKHRKQAKVVNRIKISRALETMRKAQIKGSLLKNQNVNKVCEDLMENDREFKAEFGKQHL